MVFTALKLRAMAGLSNPTVLIVVDRIDLDTQITGTFNASDVPDLVSTDTRAELVGAARPPVRARSSSRPIHKFGEAPGVLDARDNIIVMVDEAHRTQEGDFGRKMREALPNAFLFGLTGTPINRRDRNTFMWFGSEEDEGGYLSRYSMQDSIRDGATLPLHFEPRLSEIHIDEEAINAAFEELAEANDLDEADKTTLSQEGRLDRGAHQGARADPPDRRRHRRPLHDQGRAGGLQGPGRRLRQGHLRRLQGRTRQACSPEASTVVMSKSRSDPPSGRSGPPDATSWRRSSPGSTTPPTR